MIIPAIDILDGRVVRLRKGDFNDRLNYALDPVELVEKYVAGGSSRVHIVDLSGAKNPANRQTQLVNQLVSPGGCHIQVGGGVRTIEDVENLLEAGASHVVVGSVAIQNPQLVIDWANSMDPGTIIPAIDVRPSDSEGYQPVIHGWVDDAILSLSDLLTCYQEAGFLEILTTDISRDGMMGGPNVELYSELVSTYPDLQFQASGGVSKIEDVQELNIPGVSGVIVGRALLDGRIILEDAR